MDQPDRSSGKSYSDVMNEWAAQRNFVRENRSRLLHPPYDAHPAAKLFGYLWRLLLLLAVPVVIYFIFLSHYLKSKEFTRDLEKGLAVSLEAGSTEIGNAVWSFDGMFTMKTLTAHGGPEAFYEKLEISNAGTRLPLPQLLQRQWQLRRVSAGEIRLALRSGGLGQMPSYHQDSESLLPGLTTPPEPKTGFIPAGSSAAPEPGSLQSPRLLTAGFGVSPDYAALRIHSIQAGQLHVTWGTGLATAGAITGMQTDLSRSSNGWIISGNGGTFQQGWLKNLPIDVLAVNLQSGLAEIGSATLKPRTGGQGTLTGSVKLGEVPEIDATLRLEGIKLQDIVPPALGNLFSAEGTGTIQLGGSTNRLTGVTMRGSFDIGSGRITATPVMKALHKISGEDQFRLLPVRSGKVEFTSGGAPDHGGQTVEIKSLEVDCGPLVRMTGTYRQELIRAREDLTGAAAVDRTRVSGKLHLHLAPPIVSKIKPAVVSSFLTAGNDGWFQLEIPVEAPLNSDTGSDLAQRLFQADAAP